MYFGILCMFWEFAGEIYIVVCLAIALVYGGYRFRSKWAGGFVFIVFSFGSAFSVVEENRSFLDRM